jgi:small-conductance mechanosensitive channel
VTTLVDFDNKEVLKSFITDRVINWTLSNQPTRLLLTISVPTGTDTARAQRVILEARAAGDGHQGLSAVRTLSSCETRAYANVERQDVESRPAAASA